MRKFLQWLKGQFRISRKNALFIVLVGAMVYVAVAAGGTLYSAHIHKRTATVEDFTKALNPLSKRKIRRIRKLFLKTTSPVRYKEDPEYSAIAPLLSFYVTQQKEKMLLNKDNDNDFTESIFLEKRENIIDPKEKNNTFCQFSKMERIYFFKTKDPNYEVYVCRVLWDNMYPTNSEVKHFIYNNSQKGKKIRDERWGLLSGKQSNPYDECDLYDCSIRDKFHINFGETQKEKFIAPWCGFLGCSSTFISFYNNNELVDIAASCEQISSKIDSLTSAGAAYMLRSCERETGDWDKNMIGPLKENIYAQKIKSGWFIQYYTIPWHIPYYDKKPVNYREFFIDKKGRINVIQKIGRAYNGPASLD